MSVSTRYQAIVDPKVLERYPNYSVLVLYAEGLINQPSNPESTHILRAAEAERRANLDISTLSTHEYIANWRETFRSFGSKPKKYLCSLEALLTRTLKGQDLPEINTMVDIYNAISIKYMLPAGGEDWDHLTSDVVLKFAEGNETFATSQEVTHPDVGEVIWADQEGVTCRRWNWRQCKRTMLTTDTTNAYFMLDRIAPYPIEQLLAAGAELTTLIKQFSPDCKISSVVLGEK